MEKVNKETLIILWTDPNNKSYKLFFKVIEIDE